MHNTILYTCMWWPISVLRFWIQRVWLKQNLNIKGWNSHVHREFPGKLESSNLSMDDLSREIGRTLLWLSLLVVRDSAKALTSSPFVIALSTPPNTGHTFLQSSEAQRQRGGTPPGFLEHVQKNMFLGTHTHTHTHTVRPHTCTGFTHTVLTGLPPT